MKLLKTILDEAIAMFVDDGAFALAIVIWLAVTAGLARLVPGGAAWAGGVLFVGLAAILVESAVRRARKG
jgi:hypothetical protein